MLSDHRSVLLIQDWYGARYYTWILACLCTVRLDMVPRREERLTRSTNKTQNT